MKSESPFLVLYVSDIENTLNFYSSIGAEILKTESDKVVVNLGGTEVHFILDSTEPFEEYKFMASGSGRGTGLLIYVEVEAIDELYKKLVSNKINTLTDVKENNWNYREFLVSDPDGYNIAFWGT